MIRYALLSCFLIISSILNAICPCMQNKAAPFPPALMEELQLAITLAKEAGRNAVPREMIYAALKEKFPESAWTVTTQTRDDVGVQIGLSQSGQAVLGVNYFPTYDALYWAVKGQGAYRQIGDGPLERLQLSSSRVEVLTPVSYVENVALAICHIAEGSPYNFYLSIEGEIEDFLSVDILLKEAGGVLTDGQGRPIDYRSQDFKGIIACSNRRLYQKILEELKTR